MDQPLLCLYMVMHEHVSRIYMCMEFITVMFCDTLLYMSFQHRVCQLCTSRGAGSLRILLHAISAANPPPCHLRSPLCRFAPPSLRGFRCIPLVAVRRRLVAVLNPAIAEFVFRRPVGRIEPMIGERIPELGFRILQICRPWAPCSAWAILIKMVTGHTDVLLYR